jgi:ElaB/YqjD/DUF883 family membrane-anchored ribosome-binding protein
MSNTPYDTPFADETTTDGIKESFNDIANEMKDRLGDAVGEAQKLIKENPAVALLGAVVIGFAAGRLLRR